MIQCFLLLSILISACSFNLKPKIRSPKPQFNHLEFPFDDITHNSDKYDNKLGLRSTKPQFNPLEFLVDDITHNSDKYDNKLGLIGAATIFSFLASSLPANAAGFEAVPSALAAYFHYFGLLAVGGALTTERLTIKAGMTVEEEERFANADIVYGIAGLVVLISGYFRVTQYGKGWEFYAHEPIFWLKMVLFTVMGSASYFPTIKIIQRAIARKDGKEVEPMSEKLAARMTTLINGEILALSSIPLSAALMSRGVFYTEGMPWQLGAAPVALSVFGLGAKYVKEALDWEE